jgi:hypothetical protein
MNPNPNDLADARRTLIWSVLLALAILSAVVAMLAGVMLVQLLPHAALLTNETGIVTLPSGRRVNADLFRVSIPAFALSLGLGAASVWGLFWFKRQWANAPVVTAKPVKVNQAKANQPAKKKKRKK